jgi:formylglycine-generating enzyme required for sulfatase activity/serine/threonine protein kinase
MSANNNQQLRQGTVLKAQKYTYTIQKVLGQGGFGITYLATIPVWVQGPLGKIETKSTVAIKEFFMKDYCERDSTSGTRITVSNTSGRERADYYRRRFTKEANNMSKLQHENIVRVLEVFEANNTSYIVMEYIDGASLQEHVREHGALPEKEARDYIRQVSAALDYTHGKQIIHLDLKPANILLRNDGTIIVIDFGLSKQYNAEGEVNSTSVNPAGVSEGYSPFELYSMGSLQKFYPASDIYSLGATLYFLVIGQTPPSAYYLLENDLPDYSNRITPSIWNAIVQSMQPRRKDRPQNIAAFLELLDGNGIVDDETKLLPDEEETKLLPDEEETKLLPDEKETKLLPDEEETKLLPDEEETKLLPDEEETKRLPDKETELLIDEGKAVKDEEIMMQIPISKKKSSLLIQVLKAKEYRPTRLFLISAFVWLVCYSILPGGFIMQWFVTIMGAIIVLSLAIYALIKAEKLGKVLNSRMLEPEMVYVQGGTFMMGSPTSEQSRSDDELQHQVTVSSFQIGKYPVTQGQWKAVMGSNPSFFKKGDNYPVESVSWDDAQEFCNRLSTATGKQYRLPTEAEWEYAARGGNRSKRTIYSGSNVIDRVAWYNSNSGDSTHPVGQKAPNELGLYDMSGNVFEWCSDLYGCYPTTKQTNPKGAVSGFSHVRRGGCFYNSDSFCRIAHRDNDNCTIFVNTLGFRVVHP